MSRVMVSSEEKDNLAYNIDLIEHALRHSVSDKHKEFYFSHKRLLLNKFGLPGIPGFEYTRAYLYDSGTTLRLMVHTDNQLCYADVHDGIHYRKIPLQKHICKEIQDFITHVKGEKNARNNGDSKNS